MKQILQSYRTGEIWLAEVPAPALGSGGAIVRTARSLVSAGTERMLMELAQKSLLGKARARPDMVRKVISKIRTEGVSQTLQKVFAKLDTPIAMGYSSAGLVVESSCPDFAPGDRVACAGAGFASHAEVNFVPKNLLARIPDGVSLDDACFTTLGAIAMQGVRQANVRLGERVAVIGLGLVGLLTVQLLKAAGCAVLGIDPDVDRCRLARELGADDARESGSGAASAFSQGQGADAIIIAAASDTNEPLELAAEIARVKGRVVIVGVVGMNVPRDPFYRKELDLCLSMSYGPGRYDPAYEQRGHDYPIGYVRWTEQRNMASFLDLVAAGRVTPGRLVSHRFAIDESLRAYELLESRRERPLGLLIEYPQLAPESLLSRTINLRAIAPSDRIGIGFIGAGNFAKSVLIPTLKTLDRTELIAVCTATGMSAQQTASKHGFAKASTDENAVLADNRINAVVIVTPHSSHARQACAALSAGKHVFVEKPLCLNADELTQIEQAVESSGRCLFVGYNRRFSSHTRAIRAAFASRGSPMLIAYRVNAGPTPQDSWLSDPEQGGGRIIGEMCHFVDWCECITGSTPVRVSAESVQGSDDSLVATIRYADGSVATIQYVSIGPPQLPKERVEVFSGGAAAVMTDFVSTEFFGIKRPTLRTKQDKGFAAELTAFLDVVKQGGEPPMSFASAARTSRVTFAILAALRMGREVTVETATA